MKHRPCTRRQSETLLCPAPCPSTVNLCLISKESVLRAHPLSRKKKPAFQKKYSCNRGEKIKIVYMNYSQKKITTLRLNFTNLKIGDVLDWEKLETNPTTSSLKDHIAF